MLELKIWTQVIEELVLPVEGGSSSVSHVEEAKH